MAKPYWLWLYYRADRYEDVEDALSPWKQWGSVTGSGVGAAGVADISWEHGRIATAMDRAKKMHKELSRARVPHQIKIVDHGPDGEIYEEMFSVGRYPKKRRRKRR